MNRQRVFFALWPDAEVSQALHAAARAAQKVCGGRLMRCDTLHLTLAFLGEIGSAQLDVAIGVAAKVGAGETPLSFAIDRLGYWRHNRILWGGCENVPPALVRLADDLAGRLRDNGLVHDQRPFAAHVTLLRNATCAALPALPAPLVWTATEFVLVESRPSAAGAHYHVLCRWPLVKGALG